MKFLMFVDGDTAAVVLHGDRVVLVDSHLNMCAEACHGLVDRVVYCFVNQMVQTLFADVANVHCRAFAHRFQSFQHLNIAG